MLNAKKLERIKQAMSKVSVSYSGQAGDAIRDLARRSNSSDEEVLKRALLLYEIALKEGFEKDYALQITDKEGKPVKTIRQ